MHKARTTSRPISAPAWHGGEPLQAQIVEKLKDRDASGDLIARAQHGDASALRELVLLWQPRVRNLVRYLVRGDDQVDDLSQQALLTALEKRTRFVETGASKPGWTASCCGSPCARCAAFA